MPSIFTEFRDFAIKGNVMDLAVGVIIGAAFGAVVTSLVNDVLMPPIGRITGNVDFRDLFITLNGAHYPSLVAAKAAGAPTLNYGVFLNTVLNFLIVAAVIFVMIKQLNRFHALKPAPATKPCPYCTSTIAKAAIRCPQCTSTLEAG